MLEGPLAQARTLTAIGALNSVLVASTAAGALTGDRRRLTNLSCGPGLDLALALAGVHVNVEGAEHIDGARPAVIAFNHSSNLDPLVVGKVVRRDFTSTGKAEVRRDPVAAPMAYALDVLLIDRSDPEQARGQIAAAGARLRAGTSVMIAPEGTRNPGPEPGPFRTGVVHLALSGGVPILPVVLRGARALMPGRAITPGTVEVSVLAPVATDGWDAADARRHAEELRTLMAAAI